MSLKNNSWFGWEKNNELYTWIGKHTHQKWIHEPTKKQSQRTQNHALKKRETALNINAIKINNQKRGTKQSRLEWWTPFFFSLLLIKWNEHVFRLWSWLCAAISNSIEFQLNFERDRARKINESLEIVDWRS